MKTSYYYLIALLLLIVCGAAIGIYLYIKPSPHAGSLKADFTMNSVELTTAFQSNGEKAAKEYVGKVIQVSGKISEISTNDKGLSSVIIEGANGSSINCILEESLKQQISKGEQISIKGFCSGWDDMFNEVKLHSCAIMNKKI